MRTETGNFVPPARRAKPLASALQLGQRATAGDLLAGEFETGGEIAGEARDDEAGGGIQQHDVALRAALGAVEDRGEDRGIRRAIAAAQVVERADRADRVRADRR